MWNTEAHRRPPGMCSCLIEFSPLVHFKEEASINSSLVVLFDSNVGRENPFTSFRFSEHCHGAHIFHFGQDITWCPHRLLNTFIGYCSNSPLLPNADIAKNVPLDWNLMCPTARYPKNKWPVVPKNIQFHWVFLPVYICVYLDLQESIKSGEVCCHGNNSQVTLCPHETVIQRWFTLLKGRSLVRFRHQLVCKLHSCSISLALKVLYSL